MFAAVLLPATVSAADFQCGDKYVTFPTSGETKTGTVRAITVQKKLILFIVEGKDGGAGVAIGRSGVAHTGNSYITRDTYKRLIKCLL